MYDNVCLYQYRAATDERLRILHQSDWTKQLSVWTSTDIQTRYGGSISDLEGFEMSPLYLTPHLELGADWPGLSDISDHVLPESRELRWRHWFRQNLLLQLLRPTIHQQLADFEAIRGNACAFFESKREVAPSKTELPVAGITIHFEPSISPEVRQRFLSKLNDLADGAAVAIGAVQGERRG